MSGRIGIAMVVLLSCACAASAPAKAPAADACTSPSRPRPLVEKEIAELSSLAGESDSPSDPTHWAQIVDDCFELACTSAPGSSQRRDALTTCEQRCRWLDEHFTARASAKRCAAAPTP